MIVLFVVVLTIFLRSTASIDFPTESPTVAPTNNPSIVPTISPTKTPSESPTLFPTILPSRCPSLFPTFAPSRGPTTAPTRQPTSQPTRQPTIQPSSQPSRQPTAQPSVQPTLQPTRQPTVQPSSQPTQQPRGYPTGQPTRQPILKPSAQPSSGPTTQPSGQPNVQPSSQPSTQPTGHPSGQPTIMPSSLPTGQPSSSPTSPTSQPTSRPSNVPSTQPSYAPTNQPTNQPTTLPSKQPSDQPSANPSRQPSRQPTSFPTIQPSVQPTSQPSDSPTKQPSKQPTSQPTNQPTIRPSRKPSSQPSQQPSERPTRQPTRQPTLTPTDQPTGLPTCQPLSIPSCQPSSQPSCQPSSYPTNPTSQPTVNPTAQPSILPTSMPTAIPTSIPSRSPICKLGDYLVVVRVADDRSWYQCYNCGNGTYFKSSIDCRQCDFGFYSNNKTCTICPLNSYSDRRGLLECHPCRSGWVTGIEGAVNSNECVNLSINMAFGILALIATILGSFAYVFFGRLQKIAFERRFRLTNKCITLYGAMMQTADMVTSANNLLVERIYTRQSNKTIQNTLQTYLKPAFLSGIAVLLIPLITIGYIMQAVFKVMFSSMVLWKAYKPLYENGYSTNLKLFLRQLDFTFGSYNLEIFETIAGPIMRLMETLQNINISLSSVEVSCSGAQAPLYMAGNLVILCLTVIVIKSDFELLWTALVAPSMSKIRSMIFNRYYVGRNPITTIGLGAISLLVSQIPPPCTLMRYVLAFVRVSVLVSRDGRAGSDTNCDNAWQLYGVTLYLDTTLAVLSSIVAYLLVPPAAYLLSGVLVATKDSKKDDEKTPANQSATPPVSLPWDTLGMVEQKYKNNRCALILHKLWQKLAIFVTLDWWFFHFMFMFGREAFYSFRQFLQNPFLVPDRDKNYESLERQRDVFDSDPDMRQLRLQVNQMKLPTAPWLDALTTEYDIDTIEERKNEKAMWDNIETKLPTYWNMVKEKQQSVFGDSRGWLASLKWLFWFFPINALLYDPKTCIAVTPRWIQVIKSYWAMMLATFGIWNQFVIDEFNIYQQYREYQDLTSKAYGIRVEENNDDNVNDGTGDAFTKLENDERLEFAQFVSATITSRAMLLQLLPKFTGVAILAADLSSSPLFIMNDEFNQKMPPMLDIDALWKAYWGVNMEDQRNTDHQSNSLSTVAMQWFIAIYIFFRSSRLVDFIKKLFLYIVGMAISQFPSQLFYLTPMMFVIIFIDGWLNAIYVIIMLNRLLFPPNESSTRATESPKKNAIIDEEVAVLPLEPPPENLNPPMVSHPLSFISGSDASTSPSVATNIVKSLLDPQQDMNEIELSLQPLQMSAFNILSPESL